MEDERTDAAPWKTGRRVHRGGAWDTGGCARPACGACRCHLWTCAGGGAYSTACTQRLIDAGPPNLLRSARGRLRRAARGRLRRVARVEAARARAGIVAGVAADAAQALDSALKLGRLPAGASARGRGAAPRDDDARVAVPARHRHDVPLNIHVRKVQGRGRVHLADEIVGARQPQHTAVVARARLQLVLPSGQLQLRQDGIDGVVAHPGAEHAEEGANGDGAAARLNGRRVQHPLAVGPQDAPQALAGRGGGERRRMTARRSWPTLTMSPLVQRRYKHLGTIPGIPHATRVQAHATRV
jgi:hypothetical protein